MLKAHYNGVIYGSDLAIENTERIEVAILAVIRAADLLLIGQLHEVKYYDCDGDATCHKHCAACAQIKALANLRALLEEK